MKKTIYLFVLILITSCSTTGEMSVDDSFMDEKDLTINTEDKKSRTIENIELPVLVRGDNSQNEYEMMNDDEDEKTDMLHIYFFEGSGVFIREISKCSLLTKRIDEKINMKINKDYQEKIGIGEELFERPFIESIHTELKTNEGKLILSFNINVKTISNPFESDSLIYVKHQESRDFILSINKGTSVGVVSVGGKRYQVEVNYINIKESDDINEVEIDNC